MVCRLRGESGLGLLLGAFRAEAADGDVELGDTAALGQSPELGRLDHVERLGIGDSAALLAVEMDVIVQIGAESGGAALQIHLPHQPVLHQRIQAVVHRGQRDPRHTLLGADEDIRGRRMVVRGTQHVMHNATLRRHAQIRRHDGFFVVGQWSFHGQPG